MFVIKNGLVHKCDTEERYKSFKAAGWEDYLPETEDKVKKSPKTEKKK